MNNYKIRNAILVTFVLIVYSTANGIKIVPPLGFQKKETIFAKVIGIKYEQDIVAEITAIVDLSEKVMLTSKWEKNQLDYFSPIDSIEVGRYYMFYVEFESVLMPESIKRNNSFPVLSQPIIRPLKQPLKYFKVYNMVDGKIIPLSESKFYINER